MEQINRYDSNHVRLRTGEYQHSEKKYEFRYSMFGKSYSIYANTLEGLRDREEQIYARQEENRRKYNPYTTTLNDTFELWKELKRGLRKNTFQNYCYMYNQFVRDTIGNCYIATVKKSDIKRFFNYLVDERRLKAGTLDSVHVVLHQVFQIAVDDEWIERNPSDNAIKELKRARGIQSEKRFALSQNEQKLLIEFLSRNDENSRWGPMIRILLDTGMRIGELTGLRWCDLDFEHNIIDVNHTLVYYDGGNGKCRYAINDTKTPASKRMIPMTKRVKDAFRSEKKYQENAGIKCNVTVDDYTDFVFLNRFGGVYNQCTVNKVIKRIIRDCNDEEFMKTDSPEVLLPNFSAHIFRHTFASNLVSAGVDARMAMELLGHSSIETTMNIYAHVTEEMRENFLEKYEQMYEVMEGVECNNNRTFGDNDFNHYQD